MARADLIFGIIGNVLSILTFVAPLGTFRKIVKNKSAENYDGLPYITTLLSTSLWTFYGLLDPDDGILIMTVNSVGVAFQIVYNILFLIYAPKHKRVKTLSLLGVLNLGLLGAVIAITLLALHGTARRMFIGILCATVTIGMYAAPLKVMGLVIKTKSVEYMPFFLSFFLFLNAGAWFTFAMLLKDYYVLVPNAIGIVLGASQLAIYMIFYKPKSSSTKSATMIEENGPARMIEEGIRVPSFDEKYEAETKNHSPSPNREGSLRNPSLSRQYSFEHNMTSALPQSSFPHLVDVENGGAKQQNRL